MSNARSNAFVIEIAEKHAHQSTKIMTEIKKLAYDTGPLVAALAEYNGTEAARQRLWNTAESNDDVYAAQQADLEALHKVQDAFYEVTKDRNSHDHCRHVGVKFMQMIAAKYPPEANG